MSTIPYRPEIDGLRTLAVISVILYHAEFSISGFNLFSGGYIGVDIFFVISGYLISSILLTELNKGSFSFLRFYERRVRRILPILFTVIVITIPFAWFYLLPKEMVEYSKSIIYSIFFSSNILFWSQDPYWATASNLKPLLHVWTLSVEEQFYLIMPILLIVMYKYFKRAMFSVLIIITFISLILAQYASYYFPDFAFYMLPTRMWELFSGALLAVLEIRYGRKSKEWMYTSFPTIGIILIFISVFGFNKNTQHPSFITLIPIIGTMMLVWSSRNGEVVCDILSNKLLVWIGLLSYGLYLWHYPIFAFGQMASENPTNITRFLWILLSIVLAIISYFLIEKPFRNRNFIGINKLIVCLFCVGLVPLTFGFAGLQSGFASRFPPFLVPSLLPQRLRNHYWFRGDGNEDDKRIILVGDSHMLAISHIFKSKFEEMGYHYAQSYLFACQLIANLNRVKKSNYKITRCNVENNKERLDFILKSKPSIVVLGGRLPLIVEETRFDNKEGGYEGSMRDFMQDPSNSLENKESRYKAIATQYKKTVEEILSAGHTVVLVYPIPEVGWDVPKRLLKIIDGDYWNAKHHVTENPVSTSYEVYQDRVRSSFKILDSIKHRRIIRVYPHKLFCNTFIKDRCATHDDNNVYYIDDDHLSDIGAEMLVDEIAKQISEFNLKFGYFMKNVTGNRHLGSRISFLQ